METSERMSYARSELYKLWKEGKLRFWCSEKNIPFSTVYKIITGISVPTFTFICSMLPYFSPAEWVYFTDEEIPYKYKTLPEFDPKETSLFIKKHKLDYMKIAQKYDIPDSNAKNIFLHRRANFTLMQIRKMSKDINPEEFFVPADESVDGFYYPDRGEIVSLSGKNILVLTTAAENKKHKFFMGAVIEETGSFSVKGKICKGFTSLQNISSFTYVRINPQSVDKTTPKTVSNILEAIKPLFL